MKTVTFLKTILAAALICFLSGTSLAQQKSANEGADYSNAIGVRFGGTSGVDFKHKFDSRNSMEVIVGAFRNAYGVTGLYERNVLTQVTGLNLYFGLGGHIARTYSRRIAYYGNDRYYYTTYSNGVIIGVDGVAGIEYKIPKVPLLLSLDIKPFVEFYRGYGSYLDLDPGIGIRFTF